MVVSVMLVPVNTQEAARENGASSVRYYSCGWEVDWSKRSSIDTANSHQVLVWGRKPTSFQKRARNWHWVTYPSLTARGIKWVPAKPYVGRHKSSSGYVVRALRALTPQEKEVAMKYDLWLGESRGYHRGVKEHRLVAAMKYGGLAPNLVVRHLNGDKTDNRPQNLVLGTRKDNALDHKTAHLMLMYWRERALKAEGVDVLKALSL